MILNTIEECKNFIPPIINYSYIEYLQREKNIEELYKYLQFRNIPHLHSLLIQKYTSEHINEYPSDLVSWYINFIQKSFPQYPQRIRETLRWYSRFDKDFNYKLSNYCEQWNLDENYVLHKLNSSADFANNFIKDPSKQTLHQHFAAQWISDNLPFIDNFRELPASGDNAYYIDNGMVFSGKEINTATTGKSIDFYWEYKILEHKICFYATHKHTKIHGGSQDNQLHDVFEFHKNAKQSTDPNKFLLSITDGQYYQDRYTKEKNCELNAIEFIKKEYCSKRNTASYTNHLLLDIIPIIEDWIKTQIIAKTKDQQTIIDTELEKLAIIKEKYNKIYFK